MNKRAVTLVGASMPEQIAEHRRCLASVEAQVPLLEALADRLVACFRSGGRLYVFGNGGSAADAQHIAAELVGRLKRDRQALPAVALTTDSSNLTAISNDTGFENVFARQVEALVRKEDVVWALSVSGRSPNVVAALKSARRIGAYTIGFTGRSGGDIVEMCDVCFRADNDASDRVQEMHTLAYHLVCDRVEEEFEGLKV